MKAHNQIGLGICLIGVLMGLFGYFLENSSYMWSGVGIMLFGAFFWLFFWFFDKFFSTKPEESAEEDMENANVEDERSLDQVL